MVGNTALSLHSSKNIGTEVSTQYTGWPFAETNCAEIQTKNYALDSTRGLWRMGRSAWECHLSTNFTIWSNVHLIPTQICLFVSAKGHPVHFVLASVPIFIPAIIHVYTQLLSWGEFSIASLIAFLPRTHQMKVGTSYNLWIWGDIPLVLHHSTKIKLLCINEKLELL